MEHNTHIVGMCRTDNEKESELHYFINHYIKICDHLFVFDDNSTNGTYETLIKMEEKFRNRFTILRPEEAINKKISVYTYACTHRPDLMCDFKFGQALPNNFNYESMVHLYNFLQSINYKAAMVGNHIVWRHQPISFEHDDYGNETRIGDFIQSKDIYNWNLIPTSINFNNRIRLYIPE